jgi:hypothetical protein
VEILANGRANIAWFTIYSCRGSGPLGSVSSLSRQVFSAQDGPRKKLKIDTEPPWNELSEYVFKNSVWCL